MSFDLATRRSEERLNAVTHAVGLAGASAGAAFLIVTVLRGGSPREIFGCIVYALTLVATYAASTLSHALREPRHRRMFRVLDQALIFLFIAGTYIPVALVWLRNGAWWVIHVAMWGVAIFGFFSKVIFSHRVRLGTVSTLLYMLLGWLPVVSLFALPHSLMELMILGGLCYMLGFVFFHFDERIRFFHATWHTLVMTGSACHYYAILMYCTAART